MAALAAVATGCRASTKTSECPEAVAPFVAASPPVPPPGPDYSKLTGFCEGVAAPDATEFADRRARARRAAHEVGHAALIVEAGTNLTYLTGIGWGQSERPLLLVLPARDDLPPVLVAPAFERGTLEERAALGASDAEILTWQEHESPYALAVSVLSDAGGSRGVRKTPRGSIKFKVGSTVGLGPQCRAFIWRGLQDAGATVQSGRAALESVRIRKTPPELARLRRANEATKAALALVRGWIEPGMDQAQVRDMVVQAQAAAGLGNIWALVLFGRNAAFPHGTADPGLLAEGEMVLIDTGGFLHGFGSDISRTLAPTPVREELQRAFDTVLRAQSEALAVMRPGVTAGEVDRAARSVIEAQGYGLGYERFTHRLGHGIGMQVHEPPYLRPDNGRVLEPGMTMSNEPGIYLPGSFGVRIEDIVAITEDGAEVFGPRSDALVS